MLLYFQKRSASKMKNKIETAQNQLVVKSNSLIQKTRYELSTEEQKLILYLVSLIKPQDSELQEYHIDIKKVCSIFGIQEKGSNYAYLRQCLRGLSDKSFWISTPEKDLLIRWLERLEINKFETYVSCRLDDRLKPFLLQLKECFTSYELCYVLALKTKTAIRLYEIFNSYAYKQTIVISLEELRSMFSLENKYPLYNDFKRYILDKAIKEINEFTDLIINYEPVRQQKAVTSIKFNIKKLQNDEVSKQIAIEQIKNKESI